MISTALVRSLCAFTLAASSAGAHAQGFTRVWLIGDKNGNQGEFSHEADGDDFFYVNDGDYSDTSPDGGFTFGELWEEGPEPWVDANDSTLGFERALTEGDNIINIFFSLDAGQVDPVATYQFDTEFIDAEAASLHDVIVLVNGEQVHEELDIDATGGATVPVTDRFTGADVDLQVGPNVLTLERIGGAGAWVQLDFVELSIDNSTFSCNEPICSFLGTPIVVLPGDEVTLDWSVHPGATGTIEPGIGDIAPHTTAGSGSVTLTPAQNTTYTLTSTHDGTTETAEVSITVQNIFSFTTDVGLLRPGETAFLSWEVDADASVTIEPGIGNVDDITDFGFGEIAVSPDESTTYTLTSTRGGDVETAEVMVGFSDLAVLWQIGEDNNGQSEFNHEANSDDFYYLEDGDYLDTSPDGGFTFGELWDEGPEPWCDDDDCTAANDTGDPIIGFDRALAAWDAFDHIFFQLTDEQAAPGTRFRFSVEFRDAQGGTLHDMRFLMNGNEFHSQDEINAVGGTEFLMTDEFTSEEVSAVPGPNVLTIEHVSGTGGWIQMDYVSLEIGSAVVVPQTPLVITEVKYDAIVNEAQFTWTSEDGKSYRVEYSGDLVNWNELDDGFPSAGVATTFHDRTIPPGTLVRFYRVTEL